MSQIKYESGMTMHEGDTILYFSFSHKWEFAVICNIFWQKDNCDWIFDDSEWLIVAVNFNEKKVFYIPQEYTTEKGRLVLAYRGLLPEAIKKIRYNECIFDHNYNTAFELSPFKHIDPAEIEKLPGVDNYFADFPKVPVYTSGIIMRNGDIVILPDYNFSFAVIQNIEYREYLKSLSFAVFNNIEYLVYPFERNEFVMDFDEPIFYSRGVSSISAEDLQITNELDQIMQIK